MLQTLRTADLAAAPDRFDAWQDLVLQAAMPARIRSPHTHDFAATVGMASLGSASLLSLQHPRLEAERTPRHIRQGDPEAYVLVLNLAGEQRIDQERRTVLMRPGDLTLYHTSLPMRTFSDPTIHRESAVLVHIPQRDISIPDARLRPLLATRLAGDGGISAVVSGYLRSLAFSGALADEESQPSLAEITLDLITIMLARFADVRPPVPPERDERSRLLRIQQFILASLDDPSLTPATVAAAHHVSLRSLHRLFHAGGSSVASWIRDHRLQRCRRELADPALAGLSIAAIARRSGFVEPASFSRAFRNAYGLSPAEYRAAAHAGTLGP